MYREFKCVLIFLATIVIPFQLKFNIEKPVIEI